MVLSALSQSLSYLKRDVLLWTPGLVAGGLGAADLVIQFFMGEFIFTRLWFIEVIILPFFLAGTYYLIRTGESGGRAFIRGASSYYFRILLPALVVAFAILLTIFLLVIPLSLAGTGMTILPFVTLGTVIPILFFTFFFDCAAVFEDCKVLDSIRRSIEIVLNRPGRVIAFFLVSAGLILCITLPLLVLWTALLYDRLLPLTTMTPTEFQNFTLASFNSLLGLEGIVVTALICFAGVFLGGNLILAFKAAFYRKVSGEIPVGGTIPLQGEYDEKGRWYKY
ncbi:MAG: hypothetical protein NQU46_00990 [Methanolinea sp.]|nr:hypothetical protein [Methanolinea sp.]